MLQNKFEMPLDLVVKNSKIFYIYLIVIILFSLVSIFISEIALTVQSLLVFLLLFMSVFFLIEQKKNRVTSIKLNESDEWVIEINYSENYKVTLCGECIVTYFIIWLNFTATSLVGKNKTFHLMLLPDSADKDLLRQLRVRLRFLKQPITEKNKEDVVNVSDSAAIS